MLHNVRVFDNLFLELRVEHSVDVPVVPEAPRVLERDAEFSHALFSLHVKLAQEDRTTLEVVLYVDPLANHLRHVELTHTLLLPTNVSQLLLHTALLDTVGYLSGLGSERYAWARRVTDSTEVLYV